MAEARRRDELVGRQGLDDGSGTSDLVLLQAGAWCLKTSPRRRFADAAAGRAAIVEAARKRVALSDLLPRESVLALVEDPDGGAWLWTVAPWATTLRRRLHEAAAGGDEAGLAAALAAYAEAAVAALALAARRRLVLDVHPSNFALLPQGLCYLDDDIAAGAALPAIGHALLRRVEEYGDHPRAVEVYLTAFEERLPAAVSAAEARALGLAAALAEAPARGPAVEPARARLARAVRGCR
jgi:hypothetical protein